MAPIISIENVSKSFMLPHERVNTLKAYFLHPFRRRTFEHYTVFNSLSFQVHQGEWLGIIGRNGSGKSTLLKLIADIYHPDSGRIQVDGAVVPFLELGVGFSPELTAKENIFINGMILGMSRKMIREQFDEIVSFAELERFIDQKMKNFSSGMQLRLAFSIAMHIQGDIYLLDEILAVGDSQFQQKSLTRLLRLKESNKTVIFVSHDLNNLARLCSKAIWLDQGRIACQGSSTEVVATYQQAMR